MIISVASGKGGTGKTTVATNLAVSVDRPVQLLDCDVEAPNAHLFLQPQLTEAPTVYVPVPEVDAALCTCCGECSEICQFKAIVLVGDTVLTFPELCHSCGGCREVCPVGAVSEVGHELGALAIGERNGIAFVQGRLKIGEAMAPPLIERVRQYIRPDILNIIDAPPGTSCPVISAVRKADYVLLVTEPTPFGLNDLKLAWEVVQVLGLPAGLVINRSDIGNSGVRDFAEAAGLPVLMEIPFERRIAEAYSRGELIAERWPEWRERFVQLMCQIEMQLNGKQ